MSKTSDVRVVLDGSSALVSNVSQHSGKPGTFVQFRDLITDVANRIVKRDGKGTTLGSVAGTEIQTIHEYVFTDRANGATYNYVLGAINAGNYIYASINSGASWSGQTLPITPTVGGMWFFCNADNRVFAVNGKNEMLVGSQAYAIVTLARVMLVVTATSTYPHGFTNGETVTIAGASVSDYNGSFVITFLTATTFSYSIATPAATPPTGTISATIQRIVWRKAGQIAPNAPATYNLVTHDPPYNTGTVTMTTGSAVAVGAGGATFNAGMVGKRIAINGVFYTIAIYTDATHITLTENFKEGSGAASYTYNIYVGAGDWLTGPRYCFAYRNPITGHLSNVSPVLEITEQNQFGRTITITIPGDGAPNSGQNYNAYINGYTQIQLFRSAKNAYTLVAINEFLANRTDGAAITYFETVSKFSDTYLTDQLAPFDQNGVPPDGISCIVYHQDRMWALTRDGRVRFTPTPFEMDYGVADEAWPNLPQFARVVPEASGMLVVGGSSVSETIVIQTARGDYSIDGFDPLTFRLFRIQSRYSGGFLYSAISIDGALAEYYRDKRLLTFPGGQDIGVIIQDKLSTVRNSLMSKVRMHWFAAQNRNFLLLSVPSTGSSTACDYTYVFDLDKGGLAYEWNAGFSAFATVHDSTTGELQLWGGDSTGAVYRLLGGSNRDAGADFQPILKTAIIRPFDPDSFAELVYVHLYVNDASGTWIGRVYIHEQTSSGATDGTVTGPFAFTVAPAKSQSAQGKRLVYTPTARGTRMRSNAFQLEVTFPSQNAALWIEKIVLGFKVAEERVR